MFSERAKSRVVMARTHSAMAAGGSGLSGVMVISFVPKMTARPRRFDYLPRNGMRCFRMVGFHHERTCIHGASRTSKTHSHWRTPARMAAAPSFEPARPCRRGRHFRAAFELRGNRPLGAVARNGAQTGG